MSINKFVDERREIYTKILSELIKAKTVNPPGDEYLAAKVIKKRLSKLGISYKIYEKARHRSNVVAKIGNEKGKKLLIATHLDTVPAGDGWETDPFKPVIKDGKIYGRGASDNKGQASAALLVAEYLKTMEKELQCQYIFVFAADEEVGSANGVKYLLNENIIHPDYAIIVDVGGEMKKIDVAEKGVLNLKVTAHGKQAHGSMPHKGVSAITAMSRLVSKLEHHPLKCQIHNYLSKPTINFGTIIGGSAPNIVAGSCEMIVNIRYLPSQTPEQIISELKEISLMYGEFDFEVMMKLPPSEIDSKNEIVEVIRKVAKDFGIDAKLNGLSGATDAKTFIHQGIPAVGYDFSEDNMAHNSNECCDLDALFKFSEVLISICLEFNQRNQKINIQSITN